VPDASHAVVTIGGETRSARDAIQDDAWLADTFVKTVQTRGAAIINARKAYVLSHPPCDVCV
jgi:malate/lactate dehydrogenase